MLNKIIRQWRSIDVRWKWSLLLLLHPIWFFGTLIGYAQSSLLLALALAMAVSGLEVAESHMMIAAQEDK